MAKRLHGPQIIGDISTYETAPDDFLHRRKEDLRSRIRNPGLSTGEFFTDVITRVFVAAVALGFGTWNAVDRFIKSGMNGEKPDGWWHRNFAIFNGRGPDGKRTRTSVYVSDIDKGDFEGLMDQISRKISSTFYKETPESFDSICQEILGMADRFGFQSGKKQMVALRAEMEAITHISQVPEKDKPILELVRRQIHNVHGADFKVSDERLLHGYKCRRLFVFLRDWISTEANKNSGIGQVYKLWRKMGEIVQKEGLPERDVLGSRAFAFERADMVRSAIDLDNAAIIARYRNPATAILATTAALVTGYSAYKGSLRDKSLSEESEMGHIERIERERRMAKRQMEQNTTLAPQPQGPQH